MRTSAPDYIKERRLSNPSWVRRNKRSLGQNRQYRHRVRIRHEMDKELAKLAAANEGSLADKINARLNQFFGRTAQIFTHRAQAK